MDLHRYPLIILVSLASLLLSSSSYAYPFIFRGDKSWVLNPSESNNHLDEQVKIFINDTLLFKSEKGSNLLLEVNKEDYEKCNTKNPIKKLDNRNSVFSFDRSGTFYIISGNQENCEKGQKMIIVVPSVTNPNHPLPALVQPETPVPSADAPVTNPTKGYSLPITPSRQAPMASPPEGSPITEPSRYPLGRTPLEGFTPSTPLPHTPWAAPPKGSSTATPSRHAPMAASPKGFVASSPVSYSPSTVPPKRSTSTSPSGHAPTSSCHAPEIAPPKGSISSLPNTPSSSHAPVMAPTPIASPMAHQPPSYTARTSPTPSMASKTPSSSPTSSLAPSSNASVSPMASPQGSGIIAPNSNDTPADINTPSGSPPESNSAIVMPITPTVLLVSTLSLFINVALQELFAMYP